MAGEISFISVGVGDLARGRAFYGALLGWGFEETPGGLVVAGAGVAAGMHGGDAGASPYVFFRADDLDAGLARVEALGGRREPVDHEDGGAEEVARFGRFALCRDDQGSLVGLHEPPAGGG
jgi:predicted enzyme related to lactoylglutathione lyase